MLLGYLAILVAVCIVIGFATNSCSDLLQVFAPGGAIAPLTLTGELADLQVEQPTTSTSGQVQTLQLPETDGTDLLPAVTGPDRTFDQGMDELTNSEKAADWLQYNSDMRGWIQVDGTNINYPVVIGPNNNYYLNLGYYKQYSFDGTIWTDSNVKFGDRTEISSNTVLFGHNWYNCWDPLRVGDPADTMFEQLPSFHYLDFAQQYQYIDYATMDDEMVFKIFAVFYTEIDFNYILSNPNASQLQYIIDEARARSIHDYDVQVDSSDKIITLSTCTRIFGNSDRQRFVVMGRLLRPGEVKGEVVTVTENPDYKRPSNLW